MNRSKQLSPKVTATVLAGAITTILVWVLGDFAAVDVPQEVAAAVTTLIAGVAAYVKADPRRSDKPE